MNTDFLGDLLPYRFRVDCLRAKIEIEWDQWFGVFASCEHGRWRAMGGMTDALADVMKQVYDAHPPCGKPVRLRLNRFNDKGVLEAYYEDSHCNRIKGHDGKCDEV